MKKQYCLILLAVIVSTVGIRARQNGRNLLEHQSEILNWLNEYNVPAVGIGLIQNGELTDYKVYGEQREGVPASDNTIFTIASVTKTITTIITLKLVQSQLWDLDEPLCNYWIDPDIADDKRHQKITTRHVLSHRSGLPNWRSELESKELEFLFEPGTKYNYSGEGFEYLRKALEQKFCKSFDELSDSILFTPMGMYDTKFSWENNIDNKRFAFRHNGDGIEYNYQGGMNTPGASGLLTTIEDFSKFVVYVMNQAGLSKELYDEMTSTQVNIKKDCDQGLGWQVIRNLSNNEYALLHEGGEWGVSTIALCLPESKRGIVVFTNSDNGGEVYMQALTTFLDVGTEIIDVLAGMSYDPERTKTVDVSPTTLSKYSGTYFIESFQMSVEITLKSNYLEFVSPYSSMMMYAESETKFFLKDDDLMLEFMEDNNQKVTGFVMIFRGSKPEMVIKT
ncbi:MAG: beta-lactamase family protein [Bacteroidales bacterium]|nr:beta-lactamase family protein [Candidatus Neomarinimicrobiota bacterium]MCF8381956.1 beta-lactamase family protein [Bacteroidales bacterium]